MNLLTPLAGFLIGYGGIMGYQVIDSTYKGEMPGPKYFGYFIGAMTLLSAGTIYALGRTDKVFNAEGDSCQNCESPSIQTTPLLDKWGEISEYKFCGSGCEGQYIRENKMLKAGFSWQGRRRKDEYEAQGLSQFTPDELTQSSAIHGDFDHASLNYSGHQNMIARAEWDDDRFTDEIICSVCSEPYDGTEVLDDYNAVIIHKRCAMKDSYEAEMMMPENQCIICGGPYSGYGHNPEPILPMSRGRCCDTCNATIVIPYRMAGMRESFGEDFEGESVHRNRYNINRFTNKPSSMAGGKAATGVKRGVWKNFFRKNAEQQTARVRTMSGKPVAETLRKMKHDKNLSAKDARTRKEIKAEDLNS